jgi:hypothetical protein
MKLKLIKKVGNKDVVTLVDTVQEPDWRDKYSSLEGKSLKLPKEEEPKRVNKDVPMSRTGIPLEKGWPTSKKSVKKQEKAPKQPVKPLKKVEKKEIKSKKATIKVQLPKRKGRPPKKQLKKAKNIKK